MKSKSDTPLAITMKQATGAMVQIESGANRLIRRAMMHARVAPALIPRISVLQSTVKAIEDIAAEIVGAAKLHTEAIAAQQVKAMKRSQEKSAEIATVKPKAVASKAGSPAPDLYQKPPITRAMP